MVNQTVGHQPPVNLICEECRIAYTVRHCRQWIGGVNSTRYGKQQRRFCSIPCRSAWCKRLYNTPKEKSARSYRQSGNRNINWRGGKCNARKLLRSTQEYKRFIRSILERDQFTCKSCGQIGGKLHVHHIKEVALYPELVMDSHNTETLCISCHKKTPSFLRVPKKSQILYAKNPDHVAEVVNTYGKK